MRRFAVVFLKVGEIPDLPLHGIIIVNADNEIVNVDINGVTRADLPDNCEIRAEDADRRIYDRWAKEICNEN